MLSPPCSHTITKTLYARVLLFAQDLITLEMDAAVLQEAYIELSTRVNVATSEVPNTPRASSSDYAMTPGGPLGSCTPSAISDTGSRGHY